MNEVMLSPRLHCGVIVAEPDPLLLPKGRRNAPRAGLKISISMFVLHSHALLTQLERYGMWRLNTTKVLLDLLPLNL